MLYAFGFGSVGVAVCDLYFFDPDAQHGAEQGVRLELRTVQRQGDPASTFAAAPIAFGRPLWRVDLLESVDSPGTLDRAHHHPMFDGWEPCEREFEATMSADPVGWVCQRLADLRSVVDEAGVDPATVSPDEYASVRDAVPHVRDAIDLLLGGVRSGSHGQPVGIASSGPARVGWL